MPKSNLPPCHRAYKYSKGNRVPDRRHQCSILCEQTLDQSAAYSNREGRQWPSMRVEHVPCPCGRPFGDHLITKVSTRFNGSIAGIEIKGCDSGPVTITGHWPTRHLQSCDCLECVAVIRVA